MRLSSGRRLRAPNDFNTRPTTSKVRLAIMNKLNHKIINARWLDLFCGTGIMSCEAMRYGAKSIVAIDKDNKAINATRNNLQIVQQDIKHASSISIYKTDAISWLNKQVAKVSPFDVIYIDPPYSAGIYEETIDKIAKDRWINMNGLLIVECAKSTLLVNHDVWNLVDQRDYGRTSILFLKLQLHYLDDTDSKQLQRVL